MQTPMPLDMALFKKNAADCIISKYSSIQNWYIGGHSLDGVMAASYATKHRELIKGIAFLASCPNNDLSDQALKVLSLYGTEDEITTRTHSKCSIGAYDSRIKKDTCTLPSGKITRQRIS